MASVHSDRTRCQRWLATLMIVLLAQGCMSSRPIITKPSPPDSRSIVIYEAPRSEQVINWFGWLSMGAMTAAGGYAGYRSNIALPWNGWERAEQTNTVGNTAIGAFSGLAISALATYIIGGSAPNVVVANAPEWVESLDKDMLLVDADTTESGRVLSLQVIPVSADSSFSITSLNDARLYQRIFPTSPYTDRRFSTAIGIIPRDSLPILVAIHPSDTIAENAYRRYIRESPDFAAAIAGADLYPSTRAVAEERSAHLAASLSDIQRFDSVFPGSLLRDTLLVAVSRNALRNDLPELIDAGASAELADVFRRRYVLRSTNTAEAIEAAHRYSAHATLADSIAVARAHSASDYRAYLSGFPNGSSRQIISLLLEAAMSAPEMLGSAVNSIWTEMLPIISPDGQTLYFNRKYHPDNTGRSSDPNDIWYSELNSVGEWSSARRIGEPINRVGTDHVGSVTPDGNTLLLGIAYDSSDGFSMTHRTAEGWSYPKTLRILGYYNLSDYVSCYLANDGRTLLLGIERSDSRGDRDLYVCFLGADGWWSTPKTLGKTLNTSATEVSPFLAADGTTLYFASNRDGGYGGGDIYMSRRLDNSWQRWSDPQNLGATINSSGSESSFFIAASGDYAYFSTSRYGDADIARIGLPDAMRPHPVVLVRGRVLDQRTGLPITADILYEPLSGIGDSGTARSSPKTGEYKIALPAGATYGFRAETPGYVAVAENVELEGLGEYKEITRDLYLVPVEAGQTIRLNNLFFDVGRATLRRESLSELGRMVGLLRASPTMTIEISGHTDSLGTDTDNQKLSESRARAVLEYLIKQGIAQQRITAKGYGESRPIAPNISEEDRRTNRRVEFTIVSR